MENQNEKNTSVTTEATASIIDLGMISKEEHDMVSWIIDYFSLPLLFIAVLFNFFNIAVYKRKCSDASTTYLISRGIVEVIYCLMSLASGLMSMIYGANATTEFAYLWYTAYVSRVVTSAIRRSAFCLTCIVTCQRCLVLAFPLRFRQFKISRFPVTVSLVVIVTTILLHIPQGLKYSVVAIKETQGINGRQQHLSP
ncbi:hypothetical protein LOTGIDRAFT_163489 [Lottia gigantea]|uniref:G-protein coupled receptors family 1 profile domain-containing protein n=1 Tax=Lottia gigantea TaxID=225164 RepID=V4A7I6_LOTGI|nr:hypothetical protein LOTGIDRAFT_163489 [Lottia gigantea]ESO90980.1 hypothetical protein LOTGIDRAFT_163489 [Lottia gigantea]